MRSARKGKDEPEALNGRGAMRKDTLMSRLRAVRSVMIVAIGILQTIACSAANADDLAASAKRNLTLGATSKPDHAIRVRVSDTYGKLPLSFEANRGQSHSNVKFLSRSANHTLFLAPTEAVLVLPKSARPRKGERYDLTARLEKPAPATRTVLRMTFLGANPDASMTGQEELPGRANYLIGKDPAKWRTGVPTYAKVHYRDVYPGIDLVYYGNPRQLEYDFVVAPEADLETIAFGFQGAQRLEVDAQGDLVVHTTAGTIRQRKPVIYQEIDGVRKEIPGGYVLRDTNAGKITAANTDTATFSGHAKVAVSGQDVSGQQHYHDHGHVQRLKVRSINVRAVVCSVDHSEATIFGEATIDAAGSVDYRIDVKDLGEPGKDVEFYGIVLSNGYASGAQVLEAGNVRITGRE
jgi:hypothetical protein